MSVYRNASNRLWYYKCDAPRRKGEKRRQIHKGGFKKKTEAQEAEQEELRLERARLDLEPGGAVALVEYLRSFVARRAALKPSTANSYSSMIEAHVATHPIGAKSLASVTTADIDLFFDDIALKPGRAAGTRLSAKTQGNIHQFLKTVFAHAVDRRLISSSPVPARNPAGTPKPPVVNAWSASEVRTFLAAIEARGGSEWRTDLYRLALLTGCRRGELLALRWRHIDFARRQMRIDLNRVSVAYKVLEHEPKTRLARRSLHLQPQAIEVLLRVRRRHEEMAAQFPGWNRDDYVFTRPDGDPWHPDGLRQCFKRDVERVPSVTRIGFHCLRHTYATLAIAAGESPKAVSQRLGHSSVAFTLQQYAHVMADHDSQSADRVARLLFED